MSVEAKTLPRKYLIIKTIQKGRQQIYIILKLNNWNNILLIYGTLKKLLAVIIFRSQTMHRKWMLPLKHFRMLNDMKNQKVLGLNYLASKIFKSESENRDY